MQESRGPDEEYRGFRGATWRSGIVALATLAVIVYLTFDRIIPRYDPHNYAPRGIWYISIGILALGLGRAAFEAYRLRNEWNALELLQGDQNLILTRYSGTVVAFRLAAVRAAVEDRRVEREFRHSNRSLAAARLAGIGALTRFGSSALLVMAVLGTFAGMGSALPSLVDAIAAAAPSGQAVLSSTASDGSLEIQNALGLVADAFGSNFLALFGSLVLGLVAFGASLERRDLLTRLEVLSERRLYRQLPADADATELQNAVSELQRSVAAVADIGFAVDRLGTGIGDLRNVLRETLADMQSAFSTTIQQHAVRSQQQMNEAIGQLVGTLGTTSRALDATAVSYQGLVKGLEERDLGVRRAADVLAEHSRGLLGIEERSSQTAMQAAKAAESATKTLERVSAIADVALPAFVRSADDISAAVGSQVEQVVLAIALLQASGEQHQQSGSTLVAISNHLATMAAETPLLHRELHSALVDQVRDSLTRHGQESKDASQLLEAVVTQQLGKTIDAVNAVVESTSEAARQLVQSIGGEGEQVKMLLKESSAAERDRHLQLVVAIREALAQLGDSSRDSTNTLGMIVARHADNTAVAISHASAATVAAVRAAEQATVGTIGGAVRAAVNAVHSAGQATSAAVEGLRVSENGRRLDSVVQNPGTNAPPRANG